MTPEEYIEQNWGEGWLRNQWEAGDVQDALKEYAQSRLKEIMPTDEEIGKMADKLFPYSNYSGLIRSVSFANGAKWLKSEIEKRNK